MRNSLAKLTVETAKKLILNRVNMTLKALHTELLVFITFGVSSYKDILLELFQSVITFINTAYVSV